ncbi:MAG: transposase, partial [Chloroflexota bacterium]|nr:transposase [Chloroflexota bacterium]
MPERRYREVACRSQVMLLPPCLDDYVSEHNPVRAIDAFVGTLDLQALGFQNTEAHCGAGQPAYDPGLLLKLYLYGYQHRVRSSRRLEVETHRNLEVIW